MKYKINEIFYSLQGEGYHVGTAFVFVRFSGCNLSCSFCDTKHKPFYRMSAEEILKEASKYSTKNIIFTGGEPSLQLDSYIISLFKEEGYYIAVESNGTKKLPEKIDWVTISPKKGYITKGNELKIIWSLFNDFKHLLKNFEVGYIQPESEQNTEEIINYIKNNPEWKLSIQIQKILKIK